jgi:hypothetical protein
MAKITFSTINRRLYANKISFRDKITGGLIVFPVL